MGKSIITLYVNSVKKYLLKKIENVECRLNNKIDMVGRVIPERQSNVFYCDECDNHCVCDLESQDEKPFGCTDKNKTITAKWHRRYRMVDMAKF